MMRDIKFRAWHKECKKMFKIGQITLEKGIWNFEPDDREYIGMSIPYQPSFILMQYTGLKDKNGKEIYEGDIIHIHHRFFEEFNYVLKWNEEYLRYYLYSIDEKNLNSIGGILEAHLGSMINEIEVIGNIYNNPDLLEKGAEE